MQPERSIHQFLDVASAGVHTGQPPGPIGSCPVEVGQITCRESRTQPPSQAVPDRLDHLEGDLTPPGVLEPAQVLGTCLPAEEGVV